MTTRFTSCGGTLLTLAVLTVVWLGATAPTASAATPPPARSVAGAWEGTLAGSIRFIVHLDRDVSGSWRATADSPDQNAMGMAVDRVTVTDDSLRFSMTRFGGEFAGRINPEHAEINGIWRQGATTLPLVFRPQGAATEAPRPGRPQEPKPPFPYDTTEVSFTNPRAAGVTIAGTLTTPKGKDPSPCVILITGSGAQDRDESVFGHKPFLVLADYLTRHGIAVLRCDDRGVGKSTGSSERVTSEDFAGDIEAAVAFLKTRKEIAPSKIGLIGHSEGGLIAPMVASRDKSVAFVVLLAAPGVPGDSVLITQSYLISRSMGQSDSLARVTQSVQRELVLYAKAFPDSARLAAKFRTVILPPKDVDPKKQKTNDDKLDEIAGEQARLMLTPWMRFFLTHDPRAALANLQCPVLALNGEKDTQISADQNLPEIRAALRKGGNRDATAEKMPGLNHLFQTAKTGALAEYGMIEETFAPAALQKISDWIGSRMGRASGKK